VGLYLTDTKPKQRRKRWTVKRRALLVALAVDGNRRKVIANALDISPHAVSCEMSRLGLTVKSLREAAFT